MPHIRNSAPLPSHLQARDSHSGGLSSGSRSVASAARPTESATTIGWPAARPAWGRSVSQSHADDRATASIAPSELRTKYVLANSLLASLYWLRANLARFDYSAACSSTHLCAATARSTLGATCSHDSVVLTIGCSPCGIRRHACRSNKVSLHLRVATRCAHCFADKGSVTCSRSPIYSVLLAPYVQRPSEEGGPAREAVFCLE
jgi:hypothetical protein